jgi:predicted transcriptional regulator
MHIGEKIKAVYEENGIKITDFAEKLNTVRDNVYKIFNREDISTALLVKISEILEHDFFRYYRPDEYTESIQIEHLRKENKLLQEQLELQKKYIDSLEKSINKT